MVAFEEDQEVVVNKEDEAKKSSGHLFSAEANETLGDLANLKVLHASPFHLDRLDGDLPCSRSMKSKPQTDIILHIGTTPRLVQIKLPTVISERGTANDQKTVCWCWRVCRCFALNY